MSEKEKPTEHEQPKPVLVVGERASRILAMVDLERIEIAVEYMEEVDRRPPNPLVDYKAIPSEGFPHPIYKNGFRGSGKSIKCSPQKDVVIDSMTAIAERYSEGFPWSEDVNNLVILDEFHDISDEVLIMMGKRYGKIKPKRQQSGHRIPKGKMFKSEPGVGPSKAKRIALRKKRKKNK